MKVYRLKQIRVERGYTQKDIAEILNVTREMYSLYERELIDPRAKTILTLSLFYDLSADYILGTSNKSESLSKKNRTIIEAKL